LLIFGVRPKLGDGNNQRFVEQPALIEIFDQRPK